MLLWAQMCEGMSCCRIHHWQPGMLVAIRKCQTLSSSDAVPGLSWIQLWLLAFVAGSRSISHLAFSSALQRLPGITREPCVAWGSGGPLPGFTSTVTIATVTSSPWGAGELAENICLPYPAFSRCSFLCCMVGVRINPRKHWVSSLLVSLPTAHNSRSICTALPLRAYHSDVL